MTEQNPYEGIHFYPDPGKFAAWIGTNLVGIFDTLDEAVTARSTRFSHPYESNIPFRGIRD